MRGVGARFVYILRSDSDPDRHYVGRTSSLDERLARHNEGPCGYTKHHRPWSVVVSLEFPDESRALPLRCASWLNHSCRRSIRRSIARTALRAPQRRAAGHRTASIPLTTSCGQASATTRSARTQTRRRHLAHSEIRCATPREIKTFGLYAGGVALEAMAAAPTTSISELPGIHDSAKHERGGAPYFVSSQNPL